MLPMHRNHDFQLFVAPAATQVAINPPSFNWPQQDYCATYTLELEHTDKPLQWRWDQMSSPFQIPFMLVTGSYRWRVTETQGLTSQWFEFTVDEQTENYLPPCSKELFELCADQEQFMMYFDEDICSVRIASWMVHEKLKQSASHVDIDAIKFPSHYRRGQEEGKRTAIDNVRRWIDRDLMALTLLYKVWGDEESGELAVELLLRFAEWSPEGPASLLRPCTWGDEVGCSLSRNLYLAYHWLSPLLTDSEKAFIRPMLVRLAYQMEERLEQDQFKQYPGHSHTSRLPAYLGIAALVLHKEYDQAVCERWLDYALMIFRGVLPFYGGKDGSWAEGPFYSSSYSKWFHPFFLAVERLSGFSFYRHPFYKNYHQFAMDFVATQETIHPFGDGFWCKRDGKEWPGFFAQNPLRIYADRYGNNESRLLAREMEADIDEYALHLLDVVPTVKQIEFASRPLDDGHAKEPTKQAWHRYYGFAGLGKLKYGQSALYYRASQFGNSSHRHADQGNLAYIDNEVNVLTPSGSYGYRFDSGHHSSWTRTTKAHNLPLIEEQGQILDCEKATAKLINQQSGKDWSLVQLEITQAYHDVERYIRTLIMVEDKGVIVTDSIELTAPKKLDWRLHTPLTPNPKQSKVVLRGEDSQYHTYLIADARNPVTISHGYDEDNTHQETVVSDADQDIYHLEWAFDEKRHHVISACCEKQSINHHCSDDKLVIECGSEHIEISRYSSEVKVTEKALELVV